MKIRTLLPVLLIILIILSGCTDIQDSDVFNTAKDAAGNAKEKLDSAANDVIDHLQDKFNETATGENEDDKPTPSPGEIIKIASWNIENFGKSKATNPEIMKKIAFILKNYDIIAVQEISNVREQSDAGCPRNENACPGDENCGLIRNALDTYLNDAYSENYEFVFSPQVKDERYLYIYDPDSVEFIHADLAADPLDSLPICDPKPENTGLMVRQPYMASLQSGDFRFMLITAHTSPSINEQEIDGLGQIHESAKSEGIENILTLGDLNADCSYLDGEQGAYMSFPSKAQWIIGDEEDTTVSATDCAYDRFIWDYGRYDFFNGNYGIYKNITDEVSDHYLIWAEFYTEAKNN